MKSCTNVYYKNFLDVWAVNDSYNTVNNNLTPQTILIVNTVSTMQQCNNPRKLSYIEHILTHTDDL